MWNFYNPALSVQRQAQTKWRCFLSNLAHTLWAHFPAWLCCRPMTEETWVLVLMGQKWVNVIMWPLHRRNLSPEQPQRRGDVLMTNPWATLPLSPSTNSGLCTVIFLPSHFKSEVAPALQTTRSLSLSNAPCRQTHICGCTTVTPRVSLSCPVSISLCLPHTYKYTTFT